MVATANLTLNAMRWLHTQEFTEFEKCCSGVNFINFLHAHFLYESVFLAPKSFDKAKMYLEKVAQLSIVRKKRAYNVDEIDGRSRCLAYLALASVATLWWTYCTQSGLHLDIFNWENLEILTFIIQKVNLSIDFCLKKDKKAQIRLTWIIMSIITSNWLIYLIAGIMIKVIHQGWPDFFALGPNL